ncbi:choice-of-anchor M domain-containing protein [Streptomyces sp. NPDC002825]|uniref:choice-of-anchor M domain-containing protein n=1 Tax=Streptomyces sp. NPDC002825 TaxID=3154666 RepID=UPI0033293A8E
MLGLGGTGVIDLDDSHRGVGEDGSVRWEFRPPWDTTGLAERGSVRWSLTEAEGPGTVTVFGTEDDTSGAWFDSGDGLPDTSELPAGGRGESRWAFSAPGVYRIVLAAEAGAAETATAGFTVRVGGTRLAPAPVAMPQARASAAQPAAPQAQPAAAPVQKAETAPTVLDEGHVDIAARVVDGRLQIQVKDGTVPGRTVWREPSSLVLRVKPEARRTVPANPDFAFLGKAGDPVWLLDQVQRPGLLWPGWSTDNMGAGATRGEIAFSLVKAEGPGPFALFNYDGLSGATVRFASADGVPDTFGVPQNTHAHGGWAFGAEGTYRLTLTMSGVLADGSRTSDTETFTFEVGSGGPGGGATGGATGGGSDSGTSTGTGTGTASGSGTSSSGTSTGGSSTSGAGTGASSTTGNASTAGTTGSTSPRGSMASTGAESTLLLTGTASALAAVGAGAVLVARRRRRA